MRGVLACTDLLSNVVSSPISASSSKKKIDHFIELTRMNSPGPVAVLAASIAGTTSGRRRRHPLGPAAGPAAEHHPEAAVIIMICSHGAGEPESRPAPGRLGPGA
jgi:hypothetical protein